MKIEKIGEKGKAIHFRHIHFAYGINDKKRVYFPKIRRNGILILGCHIYKLELAIGFSRRYKM